MSRSYILVARDPLDSDCDHIYRCEHPTKSAGHLRRDYASALSSCKCIARETWNMDDVTKELSYRGWGIRPEKPVEVTF